MKRLLPLISLLLFGYAASAQQNQFSMQVMHFNESRGDFEHGKLLEIPYSKMVLVENSLNSSSGFGLQLNFHGHRVTVDQMETMADGSVQVVLRREDGRNFYGFKPTIKAILVR
ncbi:hypothetical protein [Flagellimonas sp.]|uniref:hypothetical protein n=1 Tax=Flagellimonas sp. TaxID=2058762 RepID=UPI003BB16585